MAKKIIELKNIVKAYGDNVVVNSTTVFTLYRRLNIVND